MFHTIRLKILNFSFSVKIPLNLFAMPFQLQNTMGKIVMRAVEHGFVSHFNRRCMAALVEEFSNLGDSEPISTLSYYGQGSMEDLYFSFYCFATGMVIAFLSFTGEFLVFFNCFKKLYKNCRRYYLKLKKYF